MMKYLIFNSYETCNMVNHRICVEQGSGIEGSVTQEWFNVMTDLGTTNCALQVPSDQISFLTKEEQGQVITQEQFDSLGWQEDPNG